MIKRGDVYYADLDPVVGSEQNGHRPIVVIQNDIGNKHSTTTIAAIVTSSQKKNLPTHVHVVDEGSGLSNDSIVMLEQIRTIDKQRLGSMIGHVSDETMELIEDAALCSLGIVR
jgi:mRNA interferase MazF